MPRKKNAKRAKKSLKARTNVVTIQKLERDFLRSPMKLARQLNKDVTSLKQKDSRIKKAINKIDATAANAEKRLKNAEALKHTSAGKKKFVKAKKAHMKSSQLLAGLNKQLNKNTKMLDEASARHEKLVALRKNISQFEKEWATRAKTKKTKATSKPKKTRVTKTKAKELFSEAPKYDTFETITNDVNVEETTEAASS